MSLASPTVNFGITAVETIADDSLSATKRVVEHTLFNKAQALSPAAMFAGAKYALDSGTKTLDLRAIRTVGGASGDANGYKVQAFYFRNLGANAMTVQVGAANGYNIFGASGLVVFPPGAGMAFFTNDGSDDVAAADKDILITGTSAQEFEAGFILG